MYSLMVRIMAGLSHPETSATISPFSRNKKSGQHPFVSMFTVDHRGKISLIWSATSVCSTE